jgi:hypothetical protein
LRSSRGDLKLKHRNLPIRLGKLPLCLRIKHAVFSILRSSLLWYLGALLLTVPHSGAVEAKADLSRFLGQQSCASSGCHGGGAGRDQCIIWKKKDVHTRAHAILANARSQKMVEGLGIQDATKDARCTVCHSPMESVSPALLKSGVKAEKGVSCESCHGPAEKYLLFHTRTDITHEQRVAQGLREVQDLYGRANSCVACHLNVDTEILGSGHPEMLFELDRQMAEQPPHWKDDGAFFGPMAWLTGQATALRELSWKLALGSKDVTLPPRWEALIWLLRQTADGAKQLPSGTKLEFSAVQTAADRLARVASRNQWTEEQASALLKKLAATNAEFRDELQSKEVHRRRAEVLVPAIDRLWRAVKATGKTNDLLEKALLISAKEGGAQEAGFEPARFAAALLQVEVALTK